MTVSTQYQPFTFKPGAAMSPESISWQFLDGAQLLVTHIAAATGVETVLSLGDDYAITGSGPNGTAAITALAAWPVGDDFRVERVTDLQQEYQIPPFESLQAADLQRELDRQMLALQEIEENIGRALQVDRGDVAPDLDLTGLVEGDLIQFVGGKLKRFDSAPFAGKVYGGDVTGRPTPITQGGADSALRTDLASASGSTLQGHKRSSAAILRSAFSMWTDVFNMREFCPANGTDQTAAFIAGLARAAVEGKKRIIIGGGHYRIDDISITTNDMILEGDGDSSRIQVVSNNSRCFAVSGQRATFKGLRLEGDTTTSSSANGIGILAGDTESLLIEDVSFNDFGFGGVNAGWTVLRRGPRFIRTRHRGTGNGGVELYVRGFFEGVDVVDMDASTTGADWAVFGFDEGVTGQRDVEIRGGNFDGYKRYNIGFSDEAPTGEDKNFAYKIFGGHHKNAGLGAIKVKNCRGVLLQGITTDNCGIGPITGISDSGENGTFYINSAGLVDVSNCKLRNNGMDGITVSPGAPYPFTKADGTARNQYNVHGNQIDGCGTIAYPGSGTALRIKSGAHAAFLTNNSARGATRYVAELGNDPDNYAEQITVIGNDFSHNPLATIGIYAAYIHNLKSDLNHIENTGVNAFYSLNCLKVYSGPGDRMGDTPIADFHTRFDSCGEVTLLGDYSSTDYPQWVTATAVRVGAKRYNGANVYIAEAAGTTGGTAPTHTSGTVNDGGVNWTYWGKRRLGAAAVALRGTALPLLRMGATTRTNSTTTAHGIDFSPAPTRWEWPSIDSGKATFAGAATVTVNLADDHRQVDGNYKVALAGNVNETFFVAPGGKSANSFTITSSNATSTAIVDWQIYR